MTTRRTLTQTDINLLKNVFATKIDLNNALEKQAEKFEKTVDKFKDKFYTKIDPVLKEVVASREDRLMGAEQHLRNEKRIEKLEKIHPNYQHSAAI